MGKLSDNELIQLFFKGNEVAFAILMLRYQPLLKVIIFKFLKNEQSVEDAVQDVFIKVFKKLNTFQGRSSFKSWICCVASNTAKNIIRSQKETIEYEDNNFSVTDEVEELFAKNQTQQKLYSIISKLPEKQKIAMQLRIIEGLSFQQIADKLNCPYDTAKANYRHAMIKVRDEFVKAC